MSATRGQPRPKHVPQRTCVACREVLSKRNLVRLVRSAEGVEIDPSGKRAGRGAYLHDQRGCWERALKDDLLERALRTTLKDEERERLRAHGNTLPE
ncbi:MAG: YlxR family protein [Chloroflexi bacterium]|nr:YlxR family protein [Chloroflexota bacterium]